MICMPIIHELKAFILINHVQKSLNTLTIIQLEQRFLKTIMAQTISVY